MRYWQKYLILYALLIVAVVWLFWGVDLHLTMEQVVPIMAIIFLHQALAVVSERHDVERRRNPEHHARYSDSGQEK